MPPEPGPIQCGDRLLKIILMTLTLLLFNRSAPMHLHLTAVRAV
jgi:hypothetical protein